MSTRAAVLLAAVLVLVPAAGASIFVGNDPTAPKAPDAQAEIAAS